jgi:hypothetical protein
MGKSKPCDGHAFVKMPRLMVGFDSVEARLWDESMARGLCPQGGGVMVSSSRYNSS